MRREKDGQMYFMIRYFETYPEKHHLFGFPEKRSAPHLHPGKPEVWDTLKQFSE